MLENPPNLHNTILPICHIYIRGEPCYGFVSTGVGATRLLLVLLVSASSASASSASRFEPAVRAGCDSEIPAWGVSGGVLTDEDGRAIPPTFFDAGEGLVAVRLGMLPPISGGLLITVPYDATAEVADEVELDRAGEMGRPSGPIGGEAAVNEPRCDWLAICGVANLAVGVVWGDEAGAGICAD